MKKIFRKIGTVALGTGLILGGWTQNGYAQRGNRPSRLATEAPPVSQPVNASEKENRVAALEKQAVEFFQKKDFEKARRVLLQIQELDPGVAPADMVLARWFLEVGLEGGVRTLLEKAVENAPSDPEAYIILARIAVNESRIAEATLLLGRAQSLLEAYKASAERKELLHQQFLNTLASFSEAKKDWKSVLGILQVQEKKNPEDLAQKLRIGLVYLNLEDTDNALAKFQEVYERNPQILPPETAVAEFYIQKGEREKALQWCAASLKKYPENEKALVKCADILFVNERLKETRNVVNKVMQMNPQSTDGLRLQGDLLLFEGKAAEALGKYSKAIDVDASNQRAGIGYIRTLILVGGETNVKEALGVASQFVASFPQNLEYQIHYAWALIANGQKEKGLTILQNILPAWTPQQDDACIVAKCLEGQNDPLAQNLLKAALESKGLFVFQSYARQWSEKQ